MCGAVLKYTLQLKVEERPFDGITKRPENDKAECCVPPFL